MKAWAATRSAARSAARPFSTQVAKGLGVCDHDVSLDTGVGTFEYIPPANKEGHNKYSSTIIQKAMAGAQDDASMNSQEQAVLNDNVRQLIHTNPLRVTRKPQIGISSVWYDGNPCNMHLLQVSEVAKHEMEQLGMVPMRFNSIGVSDGISNGTDGTGLGEKVLSGATAHCLGLVRLALPAISWTTHVDEPPSRSARSVRLRCGLARRPTLSLILSLSLSLSRTQAWLTRCRAAT